MAVEVPFLIVAALLPLLGGGEQVSVLGLSLSEQGLWDMWNIVAKASLGLAAAIVLAATTEIPDLLKGLDAMRTPTLVTAITGFMVRYVDVIVSEFSRMRVAMLARGQNPRWLAQARPYATTFGAMFVRTYERGERVALAMAARGYDGTMPASARAVAPRREWVAATVLVAVVWLLALTAWVMQ